MEEFFIKNLSMFSYILKGAPIAIFYSIIAMFLGFSIALFLTILRIKNSSLLNLCIRSYVSIFRGTPMLLQLSVFYFGISSISKLKMSPSMAAITTLSLNSGAYLYEILRGAVNAIPKGQYEAAKVLGIRENLIMRDIILPQALKNLLPSLTNELITLLKDTSLISIIGVHEMLSRAKNIAAENFTWLLPFCISGAIYYILVLIISYISKKIEQNLIK
ncbi:MAG: amino acid ABC transporter permease [Rickettsia sp.]|nr:amino acid ABC transporter permease [Rickettsia sp.]